MTQSIASNYGALLVVTDWGSGVPGERSEYVENPYYRNPYYNNRISPYVPSEQFADSTVEKNPFFSSDYSSIILTELDVNDLANLSEVDKGSYLALKSNSIWDIQFLKFFSQAKIVDQSMCSFNAEEQFKIVYKRFKDELKPFAAQYEINNKILLRLRGPNGSGGELDQLSKEFKAAGGDAALLFLQLNRRPLDQLNKGEKERFAKANDAIKLDRLFHGKDRLRMDLGGPIYDGTRKTLSPSSKQGKILDMIEFTIPDIFNEQKKMEEVIRDSANAKNIMPANPIADAWMRGIPLLLVDLGIISQQDFLQKLNCTPASLKKLGISTLADLQTVGVLNEPFVKKIEMPKDALFEDVSKRNNQIYERKKFCTDLLNTLSEKIEKRFQESKTWVEYINRFEETRRGILEKCGSPANLSKNYVQIIEEINDLIVEFNEEDRQYQITKLRAFIHQEAIRPKWKTLYDQLIPNFE